MTNNPVNQVESLDGLRDLLRRAASICQDFGRPDLVSVLRGAGTRLDTYGSVIGVVGEFKQGKSSLINGLLGEDICVVDDDIATAAVTLLSNSSTPEAFVTFREASGSRTVQMELEAARGCSSEPAAESDILSVAIVHLRVPNAFLEHGISLVDTPGIGGLHAGHTSMTLAYLQVCDALLLVTDASAPLGKHEVRFLERAIETGAKVLVVVTKIDLYPEWRRIAEINAELLSRSGIAAPMLAVSSTLRTAAFVSSRSDLNDESRYPALLQWLDQQVLLRSEEMARQRAQAEASRCLTQIRSSAITELAGLEDPESVQAEIARVNMARQRLESLRAGGARWLTVLNDGFADLTGNAEHAFRADIRNALRKVEDSIDEKDPLTHWEELATEIRESVASAATDLFTTLEAGTRKVGEDIATLLIDEGVDFVPTVTNASLTDIQELWSGKHLERPTLGTYAGTGYAGLRGAQGGILVFGMMASLAGLAMSTVALAGLGVAFGGKQLFEERKRQVNARRQQARQLLRQFLDDAQFSVLKDMRDRTRYYQRQLRDHFSSRLAELMTANTRTLEALQLNLRQGQTARTERIENLKQAVAEIDALQGQHA